MTSGRPTTAGLRGAARFSRSTVESSHVRPLYRWTIVSLPPFQHLVDEHGDDVAQQAWTQALAAYPRLTHARNLRSWLLTITHRCAMDHHRAARRTTPHEDPSLLAQAPTLPPPEAPDGDLWT